MKVKDWYNLHFLEYIHKWRLWSPHGIWIVAPSTFPFLPLLQDYIYIVGKLISTNDRQLFEKKKEKRKGENKKHNQENKSGQSETKCLDRERNADKIHYKTTTLSSRPFLEREQILAATDVDVIYIYILKEF